MPPHDLIHAPDGRLWYDMLLAEAEKRGKFQDALCMIARRTLIVEMEKVQKQPAYYEDAYDLMIGIARNAIA